MFKIKNLTQSPLMDSFSLVTRHFLLVTGVFVHDLVEFAQNAMFAPPCATSSTAPCGANIRVLGSLNYRFRENYN
jgi:hypothetical protein